MQPLQGLGVLVTRPEHQSMPLCRLLEAAGARAYRLPAIVIEPNGSRRELTARFGEVRAFDLIVFLSANAVRFGAALLEQKRELTLVAVGPATARALNQAGYRVAIVPVGGFDSENLLADPRLQQLAGRRILLVKGCGGREFLEAELTRRGAAVESAEVYRRVAAVPDAAQLQALTERFDAGEVHVITATSREIAEALLGFATPALRAHFERVHWIVPSGRIASAVRLQGVGAALLRADSAEDQDLLAELLRWRSSTSAA